MGRANHGSALADREDTSLGGKESFPPLKALAGKGPTQRPPREKILPEGKERRELKRQIREMARDCALHPMTRQKEIAAFMNISEGRLSEWLATDKMPIPRAFQIIQFWIHKRRETNTSFDQRLEQVFGTMMEMIYGDFQFRGLF